MAEARTISDWGDRWMTAEDVRYRRLLWLLLKFFEGHFSGNKGIMDGQELALLSGVGFLITVEV